MLINIEKELQPLIDKCRSQWITEEYRGKVSDSKILGMIVSHFCRWDIERLQKVGVEMLEDSNFHKEAEQFEEMTDYSIQVMQRGWDNFLINQIENNDK